MKPLDVLTGRVVRYWSERGYGFIRESESREDHFFHINEWITDTEDALQIGDNVEFSLRQDSKERKFCIDIVKR